MESHLHTLLAAQQIEFVRVLWCDNANVIRAKAFHTRFLSEHQSHGVSISIAQQAIPVMYDAVASGSGLGPVGEAWLVPDWSTLRALPYAPGHARVIGNLVKDSQPWSLCPRGFLKRTIAQALEHGLDIMAAFENEFYLLKINSEGEIRPTDNTVFASTLSMDLNQSVIDAISEALITQGLPIERYYPESGGGQHELSIRYTHALQCADWQIAFRETVRGVALQHNLRSSFLPKLFADQAGSGCHLHLSLWQNGENLLPDREHPGQLSTIGRSFVAGILHHLPALMAITTPSVNSYRRLQPHCWSGAFRSWGYDNREAAVRIPSNPSLPSPTHIELKTVDATSNPYLALGAVIAAGLDGIQQGLDPGEPVPLDPGHLPEAERQSRSIDRLPETLAVAIEQFRQNQTLIHALGSDLTQAFLAVRQAEWEYLKDFTLEEEVRLLLERY
ncbi:glutamine synthetase family protein [Thermocoleostomius sinensis]|uniref:Glutamine synthetase family protein n=1 Tax=Thermocoleostomius sinensis A174 TaxID=2016057 RepID=A0A9E9CBX7_9CYAN|nr:glutamine synthetase family protein [Thermocoleostomius sinensis]WAL61430.1 glutamine synthetase family protein [Thermocoleostomius sinensis A174]